MSLISSVQFHPSVFGAFCVFGFALWAWPWSRPWSSAALLVFFVASGVPLLIRRSYPGVLAGRGVLPAASWLGLGLGLGLEVRVGARVRVGVGVRG